MLGRAIDDMQVTYTTSTCKACSQPKQTQHNDNTETSTVAKNVS